eukprot:6926127-Alexandrium_andersonii.AAC.1
MPLRRLATPFWAPKLPLALATPACVLEPARPAARSPPMRRRRPVRPASGRGISIATSPRAARRSFGGGAIRMRAGSWSPRR